MPIRAVESRFQFGRAPRFAALAAILISSVISAVATALPLSVEVERCRIEAPLGYERPLAALAADARRILLAIEADLALRPVAPYRMLLIPPGVARDAEVLALERAVPEWAAGFMLPSYRIGAIRMGAAEQYPYGSVASVLGHEATHQLLHDAVDGKLPRWFEEGVAMWEERRWGMTDAAVLAGSLLGREVPALADWDGSFSGSADAARLGYAAAFSFVASESRRTDPQLLRRLVHETERRPFVEAWRVVTGEPLAVTHARWRARVLPRYRWLGLIAGASPLWLGITLLTILAGVRRRARARDQRRRWIDEERQARELGP
jgi:hypothetical protein